jgi:hypothetical protein
LSAENERQRRSVHHVVAQNRIGRADQRVHLDKQLERILARRDFVLVLDDGEPEGTITRALG